MKKITITIGFTGAATGSVSVLIQGPSHNYNYMVDASKPNPPMDFHLAPDIYSIRVHGFSAGTCSLSVDEGGTNLVKNSCKPKNIYILDPFNVI